MLAGCQASSQALADLAHPSPHTAAQIPVRRGSPSSKQAPKRKHNVFVEGGLASSPGSPCQARSNVERQPRKRQTADVPDASGCNEAAREAGRLGQPWVARAQAAQRARPHSLSEAPAAAARAKQQACMPRHAGAAKHSDLLLQLPGQPQPCRQMPMPALSTHMQQAQGGLSAMPVAHHPSVVLPPPEKEFVLLQSILMPAHQAELASAPGRQLDEGMGTAEDEEEMVIANDSPNAEQSPRQFKPDQALQHCSRLAEQPPAQPARIEEKADNAGAYAKAEVALRRIFSDLAPQQAVGEQTSIVICVFEGLKSMARLVLPLACTSVT